LYLIAVVFMILEEDEHGLLFDGPEGEFWFYLLVFAFKV
jgi:hypothetical protein